jgi:ATP-dependent helicase HrpB
VRLPIDDVREDVCAAVRAGDPVVVAAPTGSGKSTRIPVWLEERGRVLVVEPRRVACRALAAWLAEQRGEKLGRSIGYRVRFEDESGPDTRILFVTPGVALAMLAEARGADRFAVVMLDEFHERSWEVDLLAALARQRRFGENTALLLCSATLDTEALVKTLDASLVVAEGRAFPVEVEHEGEGAPTDRDLELRVAAAVQRMLEQTPGDVLVFLPGKAEIERCRAALRGDAEAIAVHGGVPPRVLTAAFRPSARRRVFLATNVAETSLTIPSITAVVDSGLVRMRIHRGGRAVLAVVPISAASMQQRAGRAGRVAAGRCVRLWSPRFEPESVTAPEVTRIELDDVLLRASLVGVSPAAIEDAPWITALPAFAVAAARERLHAVGAIDASGHVTPEGRAQARLPVSWLGARILAAAPPTIAGVLADVVAIVEVGRDLLLPLSAVSRAEGVEQKRAELFSGALDEVEVQLRCLWSGAVDRHGLHASAHAEARKLAAQLRRTIGVQAPSAWDRAAVIAHLLRCVPEAAFVPRDRPRGRSSARAWGNGRCELMLREYAIPSLPADEQPDPAEAGIVLEWEWLGLGRSSRGVGRLLLRCTRVDLVAAEIGELQIGSPTYAAGQVVAAVERTHAGVVLARRTEPLRGLELCRALADLTLRGAAHRELGDRILDALHRWDLLAQALPNGDFPRPPTDAVDHVADRLLTLGVDTTADFDLVDASDLVPPLEELAAAAGLAAREIAALHEDFPRRFAIPGGRFRCTVHLRRRLVVLEPADAATKREPPARLLPRFRGFSVEFHKASRVVTVR